MNEKELIVRFGAQDDLNDLYNFLFYDVDKNIRWRHIDEIKKLIEKGAAYILATQQYNEIVGSCYLCDQYIEYNPELSGAYIKTQYRNIGLFKCLAASCLVNNYYMMRPNKYTATVVSTNLKPIGVLMALGFKMMETRNIKKHSYTGIDHVDSDESGNICINIYEWDKLNIKNLVLMAKEWAISGVNLGPYHVNISLYPFNNIRVLEELINEFV